MNTTFSDFVEQHTEEANEASQARRDALREAARVGGKILQIRAQRSVTQTQLADLSGVPQSEISRIERGLGNPTEETLAKLAGALDAHLDVVPNEAPAQVAEPVYA